ncbi:hypothetical protein QTG54_008504 [Skeletonema marinoi]|uniref:F-box domain-containing protein n=1 Tax=Skeletonema marinoi TaxID=267567 RepID=A0AAD8Y633_9STRA|nr:hypothetical protein QTG54_008504 [Skeletonema marinoi]
MMPHSKKPRLTGSNDDAEASSDARPFLSADEFACILGFLPPKQIMCLRRVCKTWREAAKKTIVPIVDFNVDSIDTYNALTVMVTAMPNLQQIKISHLGFMHKYNDGEDPYEEERVLLTTPSIHDIEILSNFSKLRILEISRPGMNGRYPSLFQFSLLRKLTISSMRMKWDLELLSGLPLLEELHVYSGGVTGNINSLRALKGTLTKVTIICIRNGSGNLPVRGDFMDLADFPRLKVLCLDDTAVTGNLLDIDEHHFPLLEQLRLPHRVYGGGGHEFYRIAEMTDFIHKLYHLIQKRRNPKLFLHHWTWNLSEFSPDWYVSFCPQLPFSIELVKAGPRLGYRWFGIRDIFTEEGPPDQYCEINWLDREPARESSDYEIYLQELENIQRDAGFSTEDIFYHLHRMSIVSGARNCSGKYSIDLDKLIL